METIIYTDCKRLAANYEVDKICFADRVDISQLIEDEMNKYNIQHIHFWLITNNINYIEGCSDEKVLIHTGKYLVENKDMSFVLQYLVEKYAPTDITKTSKRESICVSQRQNSRKKSTLLPSDSNPQLASTAMAKLMKTVQEKPNSKLRYLRQQIVNETLKFESFAEFQTFVHRHTKYCVDKQAIKTYIFKTKTETISFSFIEANKKQLIKSIIELDCEKIYDAKLNMTKKSTFQMSNNHQHQLKKYTKHLSMTHTLYNKIILFLFNDNKTDEFNRTRKKLKYCSGNKENPSIEALAEWKIKEQNIDILTKLQKECELIKREIQNERILFRNKIKAIQNYIGDTINIEKLVQEEDQLPSNSQLPNNIKGRTPLFKKTQNKKESINPSQLEAINNMSKISNSNSSFITTEFKRLKDISDAMRNIDNTLFQQNKKIETYKNNLKNLIKSKDSIVYANARQINKIKSGIVYARKEIQRKELQIKEKKKNGTFQTIVQYKNREPSMAAIQRLQQYKEFVYTITSNNQSVDLSERKDQKESNNQKVMDQGDKRQVHKSMHTKLSNFKEANSKYKQKLLKQVQQCALLQNKRRQDHLKLIRKLTKKQLDIDQQQSQINQRNNIDQAQLQYKNAIIIKELYSAYQYYLENREIIDNMHLQISSFKEIPQISMNTYIKEVTHHHAVEQEKYDRAFFSKMKQMEQTFQLKQKDFPILNEYIEKIKNNKENIEKLKLQKTVLANSKTFSEKSRFPKNCFQMLTGCQGRKKSEKIQMSQTNQSIKSQFFDKVVQALDNSKKKNDENSIKLFSKQKRTTIEQAISLNTSLFQKKEK